ncbi:MAG: energy-coupling factor ABC transporter ATP-binding protein [Peptococcaceae bacterium]|nr:energy-coupling factor ABC transporter ATP-binding protein [Peptococcaceae bacterium]
MPVLEARNLTHVFADGTTALRDVSLKIGEGEFVILTGANGSGKTVFVRHLNGLLLPTQGVVTLDDVPITHNLVEVRRSIGLVFQDADSQIIGQTVAEDVAFGPENLRWPREAVQRVVKEALAVVGMEELSDRNPHTLSGGQKRRLTVAGVLAMKPGILIFDEPFTGLDYRGVVQILERLVRLHELGHTVVLVTHELEKALAHADRLVVFDRGRLAEDGEPTAVIEGVEKYGVRRPHKTGEELSALTWLR